MVCLTTIIVSYCLVDKDEFSVITGLLRLVLVYVFLIKRRTVLLLLLLVALYDQYGKL
jgi:hypothetical protein